MAKSKDPDRGAAAPPADDAAAFRAAVSDVKPLVHQPLAGLGPKQPKPRLRRPAPVDDIDELMPLIATPDDGATGVAAGMTGGDGLSFQRAGVRPQTARRLRRGLIPIEGELDLHGLSQTAARNQLAEFLLASRSQGRRCVRIVHGKGYRSGSRGPVLKMAVDQWLRRHFDVLAFTSARAIDGGTGAVYVLLRS